MTVARFLAVSILDNALYVRESGVWQLFSPQPDSALFKAAVAGTPEGGIIVCCQPNFDPGKFYFAHYSPITNSWAFHKLVGSSLGQPVVQIIAFSETSAVAMWDNLGLAIWNGTDWNAIIASFPPIESARGYGEMWASSPLDIWLALPNDYLFSNIQGYLLHWDGISWTDFGPQCRAEAFSGIFGCRVFGCFGVSANEVYFAFNGDTFDNSNGAIVKWDGAHFSQVGASVPQGLFTIWATDASHIWAAGQYGGGGVSIHFWDGAVWTTQVFWSGLYIALGGGYYLRGIDSLQLAFTCFRFFGGGDWVAQTSDGTNWVRVNPWLTSNFANSVGVQEPTDTTGPTISPVSPVDTQTDVAIDTDIVLDITDISNVDVVATIIAIDGTTIWTDDSPAGGYGGTEDHIVNGYEYTLTHAVPLEWAHTYTVDVTAADFVGNTSTLTYHFTTKDQPPLPPVTPPFLYEQVPAPGETGVEYAATVGFTVLSDNGGVVLSTLDAYVDGAIAFIGGVFQPGFGGSFSPRSIDGYDGYSLLISHSVPFGIDLVDVRVLADDHAGHHMDETYSFRTSNRVVSLVCEPYETTLIVGFSGPMLLSTMLDASQYQMSDRAYVRAVEPLPSDSPAPSSMRLWVEQFAGTGPFTLTVSPFLLDAYGDRLATTGRSIGISPFLSSARFSNTTGLVRSWHESRIIARDSLRAYLASIRGLDVFDISQGVSDSMRWAQILDSYGIGAACVLGTGDFAFEDANPPFLANRVPSPGQTGVPLETDIRLILMDMVTTVEVVAFAIYVNSQLAFGGTTGWSGGYGGQVTVRPQAIDVLLYPPSGAIVAGTNTILVVATDLAGNQLNTSYTFAAGAPPPVSGGFGTEPFGSGPFGQ